MADLAAMALERARLLEEEGRRSREELRLGRAGKAVSASLELDEVYGAIVRQAADLTGASKALLTRLNSRAGELRAVAGVDVSEGLGNARLASTPAASGTWPATARRCSPTRPTTS